MRPTGNDSMFITKIVFKVFLPLLSIMYLTFSACGFNQAFSPVPQLYQKAPREISSRLINLKSYQLGPVIPGLQQGAVPQGLGYSKKHNLLFISYYFGKHIPSGVSVINRTNSRTIGTFALKESVGTFHYGHVGGIAVNDDLLWISSNEKLYTYKISDIINHPSSHTLDPIRVMETETRASFATYFKKMVFVGEFAYESRYRTKDSHHTETRTGVQHYAWVCGYNVNAQRDGVRTILSVRQKVQGMCMTDDYIFLSISYGRRNRSIIAVYKNPFQEAPHRTVTLDNTITAPLWYLDEKNLIDEIDFPPMSEGITMINGQLAVLSESGAEKYQQGGLGPLDHIILIDLRQ